MEQAGMSAAVPTTVRQQSPTNLSFQDTDSVDAVVCLRTLGSMTQQQRAACLSEVLRVLKPGRPLIFVERIKEGGSPFRGLIGGEQGALDSNDLQRLQGLSGFQYTQWDVALVGQDPHAVGVAVKSEDYEPSKEQVKASKKAAKSPKGVKGFRGS
eukprot:jgi/Chrzof1/11371/Cz05g34110.t1